MGFVPPIRSGSGRRGESDWGEGASGGVGDGVGVRVWVVGGMGNGGGRLGLCPVGLASWATDGPVGGASFYF